MEVKVGTLNVGTMTGNGRELADMMVKRKVDILCVQETRWKARNIGDAAKYSTMAKIGGEMELELYWRNTSGEC